jgi:alpha-tubulin suppressor-like RCC1 family protein
VRIEPTMRGAVERCFDTFLITTNAALQVSEICAGRYHSAAVTSYGMLYSWGVGETGQLGHGNEVSESPRPSPTDPRPTDPRSTAAPVACVLRATSSSHGCATSSVTWSSGWRQPASTTPWC